MTPQRTKRGKAPTALVWSRGPVISLRPTIGMAAEVIASVWDNARLRIDEIETALIRNPHSSQWRALEDWHEAIFTPNFAKTRDRTDLMCDVYEQSYLRDWNMDREVAHSALTHLHERHGMKLPAHFYNLCQRKRKESWGAVELDEFLLIKFWCVDQPRGLSLSAMTTEAACEALGFYKDTILGAAIGARDAGDLDTIVTLAAMHGMMKKFKLVRGETIWRSVRVTAAGLTAR